MDLGVACRQVVQVLLSTGHPGIEINWQLALGHESRVLPGLTGLGRSPTCLMVRAMGLHDSHLGKHVQVSDAQTVSKNHTGHLLK